MKKLLYSSGCLFLAGVIASGLWATKATNFADHTQISGSSSPGENEERILEELAVRSALILTGQCVNSKSTWIENGRVLVTLATISVGEVVKGSANPTVTVVLPGGVDALRRIPVAMTYPGAPRIAPREEVFLFLTNTDEVAGAYAISKFDQGKFSIVEGDNGQKLVSRDLVQGKVESRPGIVRGNRQVTPLLEFKEKVRQYLKK